MLCLFHRKPITLTHPKKKKKIERVLTLKKKVFLIFLVFVNCYGRIGTEDQIKRSIIKDVKVTWGFKQDFGNYHKMPPFAVTRGLIQKAS